MAAGDKYTILGVEMVEQDVDPADYPADGIVSSSFILNEDLDHETLSMLFEQSPDWVATYRPDWVKLNHPFFFN